MAVLQALTRRWCIVRQTIGSAVRTYSEPGPQSLGRKILKKDVISTQENVTLPVETNTEILANFVCGTNLLAEGGENVKIKPDSEYPEWLWTLHIGEPPNPHEMDPNTMEYWLRVREIGKETRDGLFSFRRDKRDYK